MSDQALTFLKKLHDRSIEMLRDVSFDQRLEIDGYLLCLYASLIELAGGVIILTEKDHHSALSSVFRTFMEAYVQFKNVHLDAQEYLDSCLLLHHQSWLKLIRESDPNNPYLAGILNHEDLPKARQRHETESQRLFDKGVRVRNVRQRFQRIGMENEYLSVYHFESDFAHNSMQAMISRHIEEGPKGFQLALYKDRGGLDGYLTYLDSTAGLLMDATSIVHSKFQTSHQPEAANLVVELEEIRAGYSS